MAQDDAPTAPTAPAARASRLHESLDAADATLLAELEDFAVWLLRIVEGKEPTDELETIALPDSLCLDEGCDLDALVEWGLS